MTISDGDSDDFARMCRKQWDEVDSLRKELGEPLGTLMMDFISELRSNEFGQARGQTAALKLILALAKGSGVKEANE